MRFQLAAALLPLLSGATFAQEQKPLVAQARGWLDSARSYLTSASAAPSAATSAAAKASAAKTISTLTSANWPSVLAPQAKPASWMILVTGGNRTCGGHCDASDDAFNKTAVLLAADPRAPQLARVDCDAEGPLCTAWWASPATVWHVERPAAAEYEAAKARGEGAPETKIAVTRLNVTTVTTQDVMELHSLGKWEEGSAVQGFFHPFDGPMAKVGVLVPFGYVMDRLGKIPPFVLMIVLSFLTRHFMWVSQFRIVLGLG